jgi:hypothetical protein
MAKVQDTDSQVIASTDVAIFRSGDLATLVDLERILVTGEAVETSEADADAMSTEIVRQLLAAETDEELEQFGEAIGWRDLQGVPVELEGFSARPSEFDEGASVFFVVFGRRLDTGDRVVLTTGSLNIMAQLVNMAKRGTLTGAIREAVQSEKATKRGFYPLWLRTPATSAS